MAQDPIEPSRLDPETGLSNAKVYELKLPNGDIARFDEQSRMLCRAKRRDGELCKAPAVTGMRVCKLHGAKSPQAKQAARIRFADMAAPAMAKTFQLMMNANSENTQLNAASSILDRTGYGRQQVVEAADAKHLLYQRLLAAQVGPETEEEAATPEEAEEHPEEEQE